MSRQGVTASNPFGRRDSQQARSTRSRGRALLSPLQALPYPLPNAGLGFGVSPGLRHIKGLVLHIQSGYCIDPARGHVYGRSGLRIGALCADGYIRCGGRQHKPGTWYGHRLVWEAVNGPIPQHLHVDHINAKPADNRIANLQLLTPQENNAMTGVRGNQARGERIASSKLNASKVRRIRSSSLSTRALARQYGVCPKTIRQVRLRQTWRHVPASKRRSKSAKKS